jgi:hypothetical protein
MSKITGFFSRLNGSPAENVPPSPPPVLQPALLNAEGKAAKAGPVYSLAKGPADSCYTAHPDWGTESGEGLFWLSATCNKDGCVDAQQKNNKYHWAFCNTCKNEKKPRQVHIDIVKKHTKSSGHRKALEAGKLVINAGRTALDGQLNKYLEERKAIIGCAAFVAKNNLSIETFGKSVELLAMFDATVPHNKNGDVILLSAGVGRAMIIAIGEVNLPLFFRHGQSFFYWSETNLTSISIVSYFIYSPVLEDHPTRKAQEIALFLCALR